MTEEINFDNAGKIIEKTSDEDVIKMLYWLSLSNENCSISNYLLINSAIKSRGYTEDDLNIWGEKFMKIKHYLNRYDLIETEKY